MAKPKYNTSAGHPQVRAQWQPVIDEGNGWCHAIKCLMPSRHIPPGSAWDLGHTPDGTAHTGPEHPRCNRSEGATRGNKTRRRRRAPARWII